METGEPEKKKRKVIGTDDDHANTNKLCEIRATLIKEKPELFNCRSIIQFNKEFRERYNNYLKSIGKTEFERREFNHHLESKIAWAPTSKEEYKLFLDKFIDIIIDYIPMPTIKDKKDWVSLTIRCKEEMKDIPRIHYIQYKFVENKYNIVLNALIPSDKNLKDNEILKDELKKNKNKVIEKLLNRNKNYDKIYNIVSYEEELEKKSEDKNSVSELNFESVDESVDDFKHNLNCNPYLDGKKHNSKKNSKIHIKRKSNKKRRRKSIRKIKRSKVHSKKKMSKGHKSDKKRSIKVHIKRKSIRNTLYIKK